MVWRFLRFCWRFLWCCVCDAAEWVGDRVGDAIEWAGDRIEEGIDFLGGLLARNPAAEKVSQMPSYDPHNASIEHSRQIDQILQQERERREKYADKADAAIQKTRETILEQIKRDIAQFEQRFGLEINISVVEKQFERLAKNETLANLANRRYSIGDAECLRILEIEKGEDKKRQMKQFGEDLLLEGGEEYFDQLSETCGITFDYIENTVNRHAAIKNTEMEQYSVDIQSFSQQKDEKERQKTEKQRELQELESLENLFM